MAAARPSPELLKAADSRDFKPIPLGLRIRGRMRQQDPRHRDAQRGRHHSGQRPGPRLRGRHLQRALGPPGNRHGGRRATRSTTAPWTTPPAAPCCWRLRALWASLEQKPRRSALFLAVTAEEGGLRGSEYYATHPIVPARQDGRGAQLRRLLPVRAHQGRRCARRRADHLLAAWSRMPRGARTSSSSPTRGPSRAATTAPTTSPSPGPASRRSPIEHGRGVRRASPRASARRPSRSSTRSTITSPRTNTATTGISRGWSRFARFGFLTRPDRREPGEAAHLEPRRRIPRGAREERREVGHGFSVRRR